MITDTCVALATSPGQSGLAVLRLSGPSACSIVDQCFIPGKLPEKARPNKEGLFAFSVADLKGYQAKLGYLYDDEKEQVLDQCIVLRFKAPYSYTGEEVIELSMHGSMNLAQQALHLLVRKGARIAEAGEFTKRAFLNGKIDLTQAEAVAELIHSQSELAGQVALRQLSGSLSKRITSLREPLIYLYAQIELALQYPEHEDSWIQLSTIQEQLEKVRSACADLVSSYQRGRKIQEGYKLCLIGRPNAGKSSLLNQLTGKETAIVTNIPGTTRDCLEANIQMAGRLLQVYDTAGLRNTEDLVEKEGVQRARTKMHEADKILCLVSYEWALEQEERQNAELQHLKEEIYDETTKRKLLLIFNKNDLLDEEKAKHFQEKTLSIFPAVEQTFSISTLNYEGIEDLVSYLKQELQEETWETSQAALVTSQRHWHILQNLQALLERLLQDLTFLPWDLLSLGVQEAMELLSQITGEQVDEALMTEIFSKFCVGK